MSSTGAAAACVNRLDRQADDRVRPEQGPRIFDRHVVRPDMHAVGAGGERHVDAVVDDERHRERRQRRLDRAGRRDHRPRFAALVAQLQQSRPALGDAAREIDEIVPAGALGIDDGVEAEVDGSS